MNWDWLFPLLGGIGLGSLLNTVLQSYFKRRSLFTQRSFQEKKKAYLEILAALGDVASRNNVESKMRYAVAVERMALVGSPEAFHLARKLRETVPASQDRDSTQEALLVAMRNDLNLDIRDIGKEICSGK